MWLSCGWQSQPVLSITLVSIHYWLWTLSVSVCEPITVDVKEGISMACMLLITPSHRLQGHRTTGADSTAVCVCNCPIDGFLYVYQCMLLHVCEWCVLLICCLVCQACPDIGVCVDRSLDVLGVQHCVLLLLSLRCTKGLGTQGESLEYHYSAKDKNIDIYNKLQ